MKRSTNWIRFFGRALLTLLVILIALAATGATYELIGRRRDAHRFPQRGKSIHAGQVTLNLDCEGQGSPTVILESGARPSARSWLLVQPEVARFGASVHTIAPAMGGVSQDPNRARACRLPRS